MLHGHLSNQFPFCAEGKKNEDSKEAESYTCLSFHFVDVWKVKVSLLFHKFVYLTTFSNTIHFHLVLKRCRHLKVPKIQKETEKVFQKMFLTEFIGVTLVNKIIWVSSIHQLCVVLCVHHPKSSLLLSPLTLTAPSSTCPPSLWWSPYYCRVYEAFSPPWSLTPMSPEKYSW